MAEERSAVQSVQWSPDLVWYKLANCLAISDFQLKTFELYQLTDMMVVAADWSTQLFHKIHIRCK